MTVREKLEQCFPDLDLNNDEWWIGKNFEYLTKILQSNVVGDSQEFRSTVFMTPQYQRHISLAIILDYFRKASEENQIDLLQRTLADVLNAEYKENN